MDTLRVAKKVVFHVESPEVEWLFESGELSTRRGLSRFVSTLLANLRSRFDLPRELASLLEEEQRRENCRTFADYLKLLAYRRSLALRDESLRASISNKHTAVRQKE